MEDRNRSYPRTLAIGVPVKPRRLGPTSSWSGPPASTRPEAKQVTRGDPAECSHINRLPRKAARGAKRGGVRGLGVEARLRARQASLSPAPATLRVASP
jgi:hypothetical protein